MLKINVLSVSEDAQSFSYEIPPKAMELDADIQLKGPVSVAGELYRLGKKIVIRGRLSAALMLTCSRCLVEMKYDLQTRWDALAVPVEEMEASPAAADDPEAGDEVEAFLGYENDQLDLLPEIRSVLILAIPMKPLCREDCPGLCPHCGLPLADRHCHAEAENSDSPFLRLKTWFHKPPAGL